MQAYVSAQPVLDVLASSVSSGLNSGRLRTRRQLPRSRTCSQPGLSVATKLGAQFTNGKHQQFLTGISLSREKAAINRQNFPSTGVVCSLPGGQAPKQQVIVEGKTLRSGLRTLTIPVGSKEITIETGRVGRQANGAVMVQQGETVLYCTAVMDADPMAGVDFVPLTVHYQERFSAAGKTSGGFIKREGRPRDHEILVCRLIDRPLRPMFPRGFGHEVQLLCWVLSYDNENDALPLAIIAASAALCVSDIPLSKPVAGVRVGMLEGQGFVINPTSAQMAASKLDLIIAGTSDAVLMIEGYCDFLTEEQMLEAVTVGHAAVAQICHALDKWATELGVVKNRGVIKSPPADLDARLQALVGAELDAASRLAGKQAREAASTALLDRCLTTFTAEGRAAGAPLPETWEDEVPEEDEDAPEDGELHGTNGKNLRKTPHTDDSSHPIFEPSEVKNAFKSLQSQTLRAIIRQENRRSDGRSSTDVRVIDASSSVLPRAHGSALFTRGETQALAVVTLGGEQMALRSETLDGMDNTRFYLQYSFPPCAVGEVGRMAGPGRREIGHGMLAERALTPALPPKDEFPYTMRVESTITESNGSSSMASVCGGCLALLDAGVPLKTRVAGVAMGLILGASEDDTVVLTDIMGSEDALGDMDFKVAGDEKSITAFQMDIKVEGITINVMAKALAQAREARLHILDEMAKCDPPPAGALSKYAPRIHSMKIDPSKVMLVIGTGGKNVKAIIAESGVEAIDLDDTGMVRIVGRGPTEVTRAVQLIEGMVLVPEIGAIYRDRVVKKIVPFGCFVEISPGKEGLCHISELDIKRVNEVSEIVKEGDKVSVKLVEITDRGQLRLSRRAVLLLDSGEEDPRPSKPLPASTPPSTPSSPIDASPRPSSRVPASGGSRPPRGGRINSSNGSAEATVKQSAGAVTTEE